MWQTDWAERQRQITKGTHQNTSLLPANVSSVYLLSWAEHCIECAVPDCFKLCPLYIARLDLKCARFKHGISPNPQYPGLLPFGAEVQFRRWGKLESTFGFGSVSSRQIRGIDRADRFLLLCTRTASSLLSRVSPKRRLSGAYAVFREHLLRALTRHRRETFDEFVVEVWNLQTKPVRLVIECSQQGPRFRTSVLLEPGRTIQRIPVASMSIDLYGTFGMIRVYPEKDTEAHLVFSWLDFVKYQRSSEQHVPLGSVGLDTRKPQSADKVKCVIWDLDQTVWDGILSEQDVDKISLRPEALRTMLALDERGILQSIASKNDYDNAWSVLERLGVAHLFLYPQINWEPKSADIQRIVTSLNIGIESCVFIDDSAFERAEVAHACPGVRVLADSDVPTLLVRPEFDVPVTAEGKQRRTFYVSESQRRQEAIAYGDRYESFLRTCKMAATLFKPTELEHVDRCLELLHRSNQLNLSTNRYTRDEFARLLEQPDALCICTSCHDRFGDYGIVGFASLVLSKESIVLKDFVLSCRVAQKKVENGWFRWCAGMAKSAGFGQIYAPYVKTPRNGVLLNALLEVGFVQAGQDGKGSRLVLDCDVIPPASDIVSVTIRSLELASYVPRSPVAE